MEIFNTKRCINLANDIADTVSISPALHRAFCEVNRSEFVPVSAHAFKLDAQPIAANQWISSPLTVAKMTMALEMDGVDSVLEIGCGSGYQAAILSKMARRVFAIERIERLAQEAKKHFLNLGILNVHVRFDDGNNGWKSYAPYERILLSACAKEISKELFDELADDGILVAPMSINDEQFIVKFIKNKNGFITKKILQRCEFVPLLSGRE